MTPPPPPTTTTTTTATTTTSPIAFREIISGSTFMGRFEKKKEKREIGQSNLISGKGRRGIFSSKRQGDDVDDIDDGNDDDDDDVGSRADKT